MIFLIQQIGNGLVVGGIGTNGKVAVLIGFAVLLVISLVHSRLKED